MTRVYQDPTALRAPACTRALIIGAGRYEYARAELPDLSSVGPSVWEFTRKLIRDWRARLAAPLGTVDLVLAETAGTARWAALGVPGETNPGRVIKEPTLQNVVDAVRDAMAGSRKSDQFLFLCCGHGFWKTERFFVLSDFGIDPDRRWKYVIALDRFSEGLLQKPPRTHWLFFDCCADIPAEVLPTLDPIGDPLIERDATALARAEQQYGANLRFVLYSAPIGKQAFGIDGKPSPFCEMLIEALDGSGAIERDQERVWWVDKRGLDIAMGTYAERKPDLCNPVFYRELMPISSNTGDMRLLRLNGGREPVSRLVVTSVPPHLLKSADVLITGGPEPKQFPAPQQRARLHCDLQPPRRLYQITATLNGQPQQVEVHAGLPLAEKAVFIWPAAAPTTSG